MVAQCPACVLPFERMIGRLGMTEEIKPDVDESVPVEPLPVVQEASVGTVLREAREAAGLRLEDIAERFKLRVAQVQAVEADEWSKLPGR
ncbi:MAG: Helix-turn-helix domain, partial [Pseudomonadota bacterium]